MDTLICLNNVNSVQLRRHITALHLLDVIDRRVQLSIRAITVDPGRSDFSSRNIAMSEKRQVSMSPPASKRPRLSHDDPRDAQSSGLSYERPRQDPVYGMKSAFPGLDDAADELFYGPADDGMKYLRMVRSQASSLPSLFTAPTANPTEETPALDVSRTESRSFPAGFFDDEAYIAPAGQSTVASTRIIYPEAQTTYYNLLHHRFLLLRSTLRCTPPATAIAALDDAHPISLPRKVEVARKEWRRLILTVDPQMAQLACMDMESVLGVLRIMSRLMSDMLRSGSAESVRRIGAWAWGLLGKCREVGEMATEEVGEIRDLGKRAAKILQKIQEAENSKPTEETAMWDSEADEYEPPEILDTEEPDETCLRENADDPDSEMRDATDLSAELEAAKTRLQAKLHESPEPTLVLAQEDPTKQTRALLDMIITVVGEFFRQRDLLDAREVWVR
ncbi:hypothetical protein N7492_008882 [Penicillium capsulatum]|uniref:Uncharacterized protein n=1 Tax=Penicillium capsulatum TaxID=69766 RepID=A0A9W9HW41_9EURO|nr:hypothetical protein N7492_008882 [Penicillium capsulatum]KAJ6106284.1 hypothetical protein N7512_009801 [Penicillium capsulatum]